MARNVKADLKDDTRRRRFGELHAEAVDDSSSSPVVGSTPPESDSQESSALRKTKKKSKAKKSKKTKENKKKQAKKKKESSSSLDSGSAASAKSSAESEPAPKKRKSSSAPAGSGKSKKQKKAKSDSEASATEAVLQPVESELRKHWSLSELQKFEEKAAQQVTAADGAILEELALAKELPKELRKLIWQRAGLLPTTEDDAVLRANAQSLVDHTVQMVKDVRLAWVHAAVEADKSKVNVTVLSEERLFEKFATEKLPEEERGAWEAALKGDAAANQDARAALLRALWPNEQVLANYNTALNFAEKHKTKEPKKDDAKQLVALIPAHVAVAFGLPALEKFKNQKPANWKQYCSIAFTLSWHIFRCHVEESMG